MTDTQVAFLKKLLQAVGETDDWVEVGRPGGIDLRTVEHFYRLGLIETQGRELRQTWARLKTGNEIQR
jgi:hypothetical protein